MARGHLQRSEIALCNQRQSLARIAGAALTLLITLFLWVVAIQPAIAQAECNLEPGADTCSQQPSDPGSSEPTAVVAHHVGNPIDAISGNKYQRGNDFAAFASPLVHFRHYNTASVHQNIGLGAGWRHTYSLRLYREGADRYRLLQSDGSFLLFQGSATLTTTDPANGHLVLGQTTQWVLPDGTITTVSSRGIFAVCCCPMEPEFAIAMTRT